MKSISRKQLYLCMFIVSLAATLGSLYFSEVMGLVPCTLCWYQRIAMYPLTIIILMGIATKSAELPRFVLPLSLGGGIISMYHYALQMLQNTSSSVQPFMLKCTTTGEGCTATQIIYFGFVTIPFLAGIAFAMISIFAVMCLRRQHA